MEITGTQLVPASRHAVWDALFDPAVLKRCLPGCVSVERRGDDAFDVVMTAAVGPLRARFNGSLQMRDADAPSSCTMTFEGQGGVVGFGKGRSTVRLREADGGATELNYTAEAQVGGKLAQVGSRLIDSVARKMADDFFVAFRKHLAGTDGATGEVAEATPAPTAASPRITANLPASADAAAAAQAPASANTPSDVVVHPRAPADAPTAVHRPEPLAAPAAVEPRWVDTRVPGWWLAVAAVLGAAATGFGTLIGH